EPATLRLEVEPPTLRLELLLATLRLEVEAAAVRLSLDVLFTDLEAILLDAGVTLRLELDPNAAVRLAVLRLRFLSQP
ncbi:hypothetical protein, partial [Klebsiella pneumoniae]|uniref:hypothetical protein n=1 Tax=Klebsiella pneumoniae TaxID=573 RepID=UPI0025A2A191